MWSFPMVRKNIFYMLLLFLLASPARAFQPVFFQTANNNSFEKAAHIDDLTIPKLIYGRLEAAGEVDFYTFTVLEKTKLPIKLLVPYTAELVNLHPTLVILSQDVPATPQKLPFVYPEEQKALVIQNPNQTQQQVYYDKISFEYFFAGPEIELDFSPEYEYTLAIFDPLQKTGTYALGLGNEGARDVSSYFQSINGLFRVKMQTSDWQQWLAYFLILLASGMILNALIFNFFKSAEKKKKLLAIVGNLLIASLAILMSITVLTRPQKIINPPPLLPTPVPTPAELTAQQPRLQVIDLEPGKVIAENPLNLRFEIENYPFELKQGGISLILDYQTPLVLNTNEYQYVDLSPGFHSLQAFLIDKNKKAFKNPESFVITYFYIGLSATEQKIDLKKPILVLNTNNQPRVFKIEEFEQIGFWIDFFTVNAYLSPAAYKIQYTLDTLEPRSLTTLEEIVIREPLAAGKHTIAVAIVDSNNALADAEYASQTIELEIISDATPTETVSPTSSIQETATTPTSTQTPTTITPTPPEEL